MSPRRTHRPHLSTDTSTTLPEYSDLHRHSDLPPGYPDSVQDATDDDETLDTDINVSSDTDKTDRRHDVDKATRYPLSSSPTPKRPTHRSRPSYPTPDQYLDSLLERSVHALEMSNVLLLHSSLSTQSSLSPSRAPDSLTNRPLEARPRGVSSVTHTTPDMHDHWLDDLDDIRRGVEDLFDFDSDHKPTAKSSSSAMISSSLPATSSIPSQLASRRHRSLRSASSLDVSSTSVSDVPHLHLSHQQDRCRLISPPPRALTQYVVSSTDADLVLLPSTIGLRAPPSASHIPVPSSTESRPPPPPQSFLHSSTAPPTVTDCPFEPSTPAYNMLSSLITRTVSASSSGPITPASSKHVPFSSLTRRHSGSSFSTITTPGSNSGRDHYRSRPRTTPTSPEQKLTRSSHCPSSYLRTVPPPQTTRTTSLPPIHRCPPIKELSPSPSPPSSSSDDHFPTKLTVQSLRKILDEQPCTTTTNKYDLPPRAPAFLPRSPPPAPTLSTSTATASISRLFTKGTHSSSTRASSPPRHSSLKPHQRNSESGTPVTPLAMEFRGLGRGSAPSSGRSTPKKITFAEPFVTRGLGSGEGTRTRTRGRAGRRRVGGGKARKRGSGSGGEGESWWATWLAGAASAPFTGMGAPSPNALMHEERRVSTSMDCYLT